jgi:rhodanese-related sulfurtransferase
MKHLLSVSLLVLSSGALAQQADTTQGGAIAAAAKEPSFKAHVLSNAELDKLLEHPEKLLFVDVRRPDELTSIGGFPAYFSVQQADVEKNLQWIPKDRAIVTVSNHAARAGKTADLLAGKGFKVVGAIGAETYEKAGGKIAHIAKPEPKAGAATTAAVIK